MRPLIQRKIEFSNTCGCIVDYKFLEKAIVWYSKGNPVKSVKKIFMHGKYPAISCYDKKIQVHRLLVCFKLGYMLPTNLYVHHIDENKLNASIDNLEIIEMSKHQSMHNANKKLSIEHRSLISEANKKRKGTSIKKRTDIPITEVFSMFREGKNVTEISKKFDCGWSTIKSILTNESRLNTTHI